MRQRWFKSLGTAVLAILCAVVFAAGPTGCAHKKCSATHAKKCSSDCKCQKAGSECPKGCDKPCSKKAAGKCPQGCDKPCCAKGSGDCPCKGKVAGCQKACADCPQKGKKPCNKGCGGK